MDEPPQVPTERIFHETKFVFLSCRADSSRRSLGEDGSAPPDAASPSLDTRHPSPTTSVVHTTIDVSLQEAWAKTPTDKKRETTHIVRCETEILRVK